jgi:hypothetical protein
VKITDEEVKMLMDDNKEIRYEEVFEWCMIKVYLGFKLLG